MTRIAAGIYMFNVIIINKNTRTKPKISSKLRIKTPVVVERQQLMSVWCFLLTLNMFHIFSQCSYCLLRACNYRIVMTLNVFQWAFTDKNRHTRAKFCKLEQSFSQQFFTFSLHIKITFHSF